MKNIKHIALSLLAIGFMACENDTLEDLRNRVNQGEEELPALTSGEADFSTFVSVGASFTAGFTDGGLFIAGQEDSFPNTLSKQFSNIGGSEFAQPLMNDNTGGILTPLGASGYRLVFGGAGPVSLNLFLAGQGAPVPPITTTTTSIGSDFNNFGIPGAKSFHVVTPGYGAFNPYYTRIASSATSTVVGDAVNQNPSFFTLSEMGGNDVLGYATSGGTGVDQTGNTNPATYGGNDITDPQVFAGALSSSIAALTANGAKGLVTNVPFITDLPHFTTVPFNPIPLDAATATAVNQAYAQYNGGLEAAAANSIISADELSQRTINFEASESNAVVVEDETLTTITLPTGPGTFTTLPNIRQATAGDLFVLPASSFIGTEAISGNPLTVNGVAIPLADQWVLIPSEQEAIRNATIAYNATIASIADSNPDVGLVDLNAVLAQAAMTGIQFDDYTLNTDLVFGGLVSLDGIHLTGRGYALMANKFLEAADANFGSNFVASGNVAKAGDFPTNYSPALQ
ncbi:MAG: G-D-S-L family lipolytic protein [Winogradskyella sp.]|uniref:G-D-S-L family lipolytic protein n=1 Tax=Winogradskyella sp. TaxID=1883156 RepID=UPI00179D66BC|nr:G-D-S-L family lipolytic protein [Winogradskyella sp.]MBT8244799.1 G-D-S-L family lipolytic protein [Winogradskyella sp.]NNK21989.1 G-D-S-L family lipolytic protein [Winogradskyella sp.]